MTDNASKVQACVCMFEITVCLRLLICILHFNKNEVKTVPI